MVQADPGQFPASGDWPTLKKLLLIVKWKSCL